MNNKLYHGTVTDFNTIDVNAGRPYKDFGKGFYMSIYKSQAVGIAEKKYKTQKRRRKNSYNVHKILYTIELNAEMCKNLNVKIFKSADLDWLDFVLLCRESEVTPHNYDLVVCPTADDDTRYCLASYNNGAYGKVGSVDAKRILLKNLETENLGFQYFISKQSVADKKLTIIKKECI